MQVCGAFQTWQQRTEEQLKMSFVKEKVVAKWLNKLSSQAFDRWSEGAREQARMASVLEKIVRRMRTAGLAKAFSSLLDAVQRTRDKQQDMGSSAAWWAEIEARAGGATMRQAKAGWETWREHVRATRVMGRVKARWSQRCTSRALMRWMEMTDDCAL